MVTLDVKTLYPAMAQLLGSTRLRKLVYRQHCGDGAPPRTGEGAAHQRRAFERGRLGDDGHISFETLIDNDGAGEPEPLPISRRP